MNTYTRKQLIIFSLITLLLGIVLGVLTTRFPAFQSQIAKVFPDSKALEKISKDHPVFDRQFGSVTMATIDKLTPQEVTVINSPGDKATFPLSNDFSIVVPGPDKAPKVSTDINTLPPNSQVTVILELQDGHYAVTGISVLPK